MARQRFALSALFKSDPFGYGHYTGAGSEGAVPAKHKWNTDIRPYCVPNEFICSSIGQFLGLPIPPFAVTYPPTGEPAPFLFSSLHFNFEGRQIRPVLPDLCVKALPNLCAGIVVFDILICNADRHDGNLAVDRMDEPRELVVYDQDGGLFGLNFGADPVGIDRLRKLSGRLGISSGDVSGGRRHCLLDEIVDSSTMTPWVDRLWDVGDGFIRRTCEQAMRFGLNAADAEAASNFLLARRREVRGIINRHSSEFSAARPWRMV